MKICLRRKWKKVDNEKLQQKEEEQKVKEIES
jgi:hypothetical protein